MNLVSAASAAVGSILLSSIWAAPAFAADTAPPGEARPAVTQTVQPMLAGTASGGFRSASDRSTIVAPQTTTGQVRLVSADASRRPVEVSLPAEVSSAAAGGTVDADGTVRYSAPAQDVTVAVQAKPNAAEIRTVLGSENAPTEYSYTVALPAGGSLVPASFGGVGIEDARGNLLGWIDRPWARDAAGTSVATHYEVAGNVVRQIVEHRGLGYRYPVVADPYLGLDLIDHVEWRWASYASAWTLKIYPTSWLRFNAGSYQLGASAWQELVAKNPSTLTRNLNGLRDQFICHAERGASKDTYNIDEWLADVGYDALVAADCNPGKVG